MENIAVGTIANYPLAVPQRVFTLALLNYADTDCFTWELTEVVEQPAHGSVELSPSGLVFTPEEGFVGFDSLVLRVDFTRIDDPLCEDAGPLDDGFFHETSAEGGADLARVGVYVISPAPGVLPPCTSGDCVSVEVLSQGGERVPTFLLEQLEGYVDAVSGCSSDYWVPAEVAPYSLDQPAFEVSEYEEYYFGLSTFRHESPISPDYWHGECGLGPVEEGAVQEVVIERADFDAYCDALRFNSQSMSLELPRAETITRLSSAGPKFTLDWPQLSISAANEDPFEIQPNPGDEDLSSFRELLSMIEPDVLFSHVSNLLNYTNSEDDKYVRAIHYGAAWGDFEAKLVVLLKKESTGEWAEMSLQDKSVAIGELAVSFNNAMGDRWPRLTSWVSEYLDIVDTANQVSAALIRIEKVYRVFEVDPSDPLQIAEALSAYLELLAQITGKVAPPFGAYANVLSTGFKNMLPALRTMRDRTKQTNKAIELWLADAETFGAEWEQFIERPDEEEPALDMGNPTKTREYPVDWEIDITNVKKNTSYHASRYEHAQKWFQNSLVSYLTNDWAGMEARLRSQYSGTTLDQRLAELTTLRQDIAVDFAVAFEYRTRARIELVTARKHYIELLRSLRPDDAKNKKFLDDWEKVLVDEIGVHPWEQARSRQ